MAKLYDNVYLDIVKQKIMDNDFPTKDDFIKYLNINRNKVLQDSYLQQVFQDSFIKLNEETLAQMNKHLLDYYDRIKENDLVGLELEGVTSVEVDGKDYIKVVGEDGTIKMIDNSLGKDKFVEEFKDRQNELTSAQTIDSTKNKEAVIEDMEKDKETADLKSSIDVDTRELTLEEKQQFASVMNINDAEHINFLVDTKRNIYINKDTGELYFVRKNDYGQLEVRKAEEVGTQNNNELKNIDDESNDITVSYDIVEETDYEKMSDSDLVYIIENKIDSLSLEQYQKILTILDQRKKDNQKNLEQQTLNKDKVYVKKMLSDVGFVSIMSLAYIAGIFGVGMLLFIMIKL